MQELISVVLPVYNVEKYLERCVESVVNQTFTNLEIILVDDGSTDSSGRLCDKLATTDSRISVIHKTNGGLSDARNAGIHIAKGKYITFIDSDDTVDIDMIDYLYYLIKKGSYRMALCTHNIVFDEGKRIVKNGNGTEEVLNAETCIERMLYHNVVDTSAWAKLYETSVFKNIEFPKGKLFEDIGTTYKTFIESGLVSCGYRSKYNYYVRSNSIVTSGFNERKLDLLEMTDSMAAEVNQIYPQLKKAVLRRQVYARFSTLNQILKMDSYKERSKPIIDYIMKNKMAILLNPKAPFRDKGAILLLLFGLPLYKLIWFKLAAK